MIIESSLSNTSDFIMHSIVYKCFWNGKMSCIICVRTHDFYCTKESCFAYDFVTNFIILKIVVIRPETTCGQEGKEKESPSNSPIKGGG